MIRYPGSVRSIMLAVVLALLPGLLLHAWQFGVVVVLQTVWCILLALLTETVCLRSRGQPLRGGLGDLSWLVSGVLMGRSLPLLVPLWMMALATLVALGLVKHAGGGLGRNRLNPVMAGLGVIAVCFYQLLYPAPSWSAPWTRALDVSQVLSQQLQWSPRLALDGLSGATPLSRGTLAQMAPSLSWLGYLVGGLVLALLRVIRLEIPLAMMSASVACCLLAGHSLSESLFDLTLGGYLFAAFFIVTDPVSSPDTRCGRILYGLAIGLVTELVREYGLYADGLCFAVLAGNLLVPQLDVLARRLFRPWHEWRVA